MLGEIFGPDLLIVVIVIAVVIFGGAAIPKLARSLGSAWRDSSLAGCCGGVSCQQPTRQQQQQQHSRATCALNTLVCNFQSDTPSLFLSLMPELPLQPISRCVTGGP